MIRTLILDVETSPLVVYAWGLRDQNIALNQILKDWHIMAWAAKWLGDPPSKLVYRETRTGNDKAILRDLWILLDQADIVMTQNGESFDWPKIKARMIEHGMRPPSPFRHFDTYRASKGIAFTSHKLDYVTNKLNKKYRKLDHKKYPGMKLWRECLAGNPGAWQDMKVYNMHDVLSTEEYYTILRPWVPAKFPKIYQEDEEITTRCSTCGKGQLQKRGFHITRRVKRQRLQCQACGAWHLGEIIK